MLWLIIVYDLVDIVVSYSCYIYDVVDLWRLIIKLDKLLTMFHLV